MSSLPSCSPEASECLYPAGLRSQCLLRNLLPCWKARQSAWMASGISLQSTGMEDARHTLESWIGQWRGITQVPQCKICTPVYVVWGSPPNCVDEFGAASTEVRGVWSRAGDSCVLAFWICVCRRAVLLQYPGAGLSSDTMVNSLR